MKTFKALLALAATTGLIAFSACSSNRTKTTEAATPPPAPAPVATQPAPPEAQPTYTMANLGASTAGRAR